MARSNVYLRSQSGRTQSFEEFRQQLRKLGTSETMRFREVRKLLLKEAQPLVTEARNIAYKKAKSKKGVRMKSRSAFGAKFYNLYGSINKWANKGTDKAYVVVGLKGSKKGGAYYATWQLFGETAKDFTAKDFLGKAVDSTNVLERAQKMMQRHIQKRLTSVLR